MERRAAVYPFQPRDIERACTALNCSQTDITCKLDARLVRKAQLWIMAGAPNN